MLLTDYLDAATTLADHSHNNDKDNFVKLEALTNVASSLLGDIFGEDTLRNLTVRLLQQASQNGTTPIFQEQRFAAFFTDLETSFTNELQQHISESSTSLPSGSSLEALFQQCVPLVLSNEQENCLQMARLQLIERARLIILSMLLINKQIDTNELLRQVGVVRDHIRQWVCDKLFQFKGQSNENFISACSPLAFAEPANGLNVTLPPVSNQRLYPCQDGSSCNKQSKLYHPYRKKFIRKGSSYSAKVDAVLESVFIRRKNPDALEKNCLALACGLSPIQITNWFISRSKKEKEIAQAEREAVEKFTVRTSVALGPYKYDIRRHSHTKKHVNPWHDIQLVNHNSGLPSPKSTSAKIECIEPQPLDNFSAGGCKTMYSFEDPTLGVVGRGGWFEPSMFSPPLSSIDISKMGDDFDGSTSHTYLSLASIEVSHRQESFSSSSTSSLRPSQSASNVGIIVTDDPYLNENNEDNSLLRHQQELFPEIHWI